MPSNPGKNKTSGGSFYVCAQPVDVATKGTGSRLICPDVMTEVAHYHECGEHPDEIAAVMALPRAAVADIIATYDCRAEQFFKITRGRK